jgi:hypothetical protein
VLNAVKPWTLSNRGMEKNDLLNTKLIAWFL